MNYSNAEYDETYNNALMAVDDQEKAELYKKCQMILAEDAESVFIQDPANYVAVNKRLGGYQFYPLSAQDMSSYTKSKIHMKYITRKFITLILTLLLISAMTFGAFSVIPGDASVSKLGTEATAEQIEALREEMGLNRPVAERYVSWGGRSGPR